MSGSTGIPVAHATDDDAGKVSLMGLVGSGDKIGRFVLPFLAAGVILSVLYPALFSVDISATVQAAAWLVLAVGVVVWLWSVVLIITKVPRHELITGGPFALMKHPLYTGVSLLVLPSASLLLGSWLGVALGIVVYVASRRYAPAEEQQLADTFGAEWDAYNNSVKLPWL